MKLSKARRALLQRLQQRKQRRREGCFVVEGVRATCAVLAAGLPVRFAVMSPRLAELDDDGALAEALSRARFDVVAVDDAELDRLAATVTPQGILLLCEEPASSFDSLPHNERGLLVADAVQDPGNLGGMIRTAAALGLRGFVALEGTVDPWNPKAVRGSAGASFRLPVVQSTWDDALAWINAQGIRLLAAAPGGTNVADIDKTCPWALAIGNEGAGLRAELRAAATAIVSVRLHPPIDSLNASVAAAILCYELTRGDST